MSKRNPNKERDKVNDCGGIDILAAELKRKKVWAMIDERLGKRNNRAEYSYSDAIQTWTMNKFCDAKRLEDIYNHQDKLFNNPHFGKDMSPDTLSRMIKKVSVENTYYRPAVLNKSGNTLIVNPTEEEKKDTKNNETNWHQTLNMYNLDIAISLGLFIKGFAYTLDIDTTTINTKNFDSRGLYDKSGTGYHPVVIILGGIPIFVEGRNGNSNAKFRLKAVLELAINLIESRGIKIKAVRSDSAAAIGELTDYLFSKEIKFYIRSGNRTKDKTGHFGYERLTGKYGHLVSADAQIDFGNHSPRLVHYHTKVKTTKASKIDGVIKHWAIITNDEEMSKSEVIAFYNMRGKEEQRFAELNELGWEYMPMRELKYNTVYMLICMQIGIYFTYLKRYLCEKEKVKFVRTTMKLGTFIKDFIRVTIQWIHDTVSLLTRKNHFEPLIPLFQISRPNPPPE